MSTPPFVELPKGAILETWSIDRGPRRVLHYGLDSAPDWVVLVPGFTGSKEDFLGLIEPLAGSGFGVFTFDQLGQYQSPGTNDPTDYALLALAQDLRQLVDIARLRRSPGDAPHLLGHSFGGLVSQVAVADTAFDVASWLGLCTGPGALPERRRGALPALIEALPDTPLDELWAAKRALERAADAPDPPAAVEEFCRQRWMANSPVGLRAKAVILCEQAPVVEGLRSRPGLPKAVMFGAQDDAWPTDIQRQMAHEIGADVLVIEEAGHSPNAEAPSATAAALARWWRGTGSPATVTGG
jgi:pimeloyl-ACP methyl ester carboxylesterase